MPIDHRTVLLLLPELLLITTGTGVIVGGAFARSTSGWTALGAAGLAISGAALLWQQGWPSQHPVDLVSGSIIVDALGGTICWLAIGLGLLLLCLMAPRAAQLESGELPGMLLFAVAGLMVTAVAADLVLLVLGLELISIPTYVLLFLGRGSRESAEATVKYFFLGILSSAVFLMGLALLLAATGTTRMLGAQAAAAGGALGTGPFLIAYVLILAGLAYKIAAVPFHFYAPDVYAATTSANAALLSVLPKVAGLVALIRILSATPLGRADFVWQSALVVAILTMTMGNLCALWQRNARRLMAYSSIAHGGYMFMGVVVAVAGAGADIRFYDGYAATLVHLFVYAIASVGAFAVFTALSAQGREFTDVDDLGGLSRGRPFLAAALAVCMFSLTGLPPLAGFWGKLTLFSGVLSRARIETVWHNEFWFWLLAVAGILNAAVAAAYYLWVVSVLYFRGPGAAREPATMSASGAAAAACALIVILVGLFPGGVMDHFQKVGYSINTAVRKRAIAAASPQITSSNQARQLRLDSHATSQLP